MSQKRELLDIEVDEISLVDKAANRKAFAIVKSETAPAADAVEELDAEDLKIVESISKTCDEIMEALKETK